LTVLQDSSPEGLPLLDPRADLKVSDLDTASALTERSTLIALRSSSKAAADPSLRCVCTYVHVCMYVDVCVCMYVDACVCMYVDVCVLLNDDLLSVNTLLGLGRCICKACICMSLLGVCVCVNACVCMCVCGCMCVCMWMRVYVCMWMRVYVCMWMRVYVCECV